jgi:hypothetical protein
MNEKWTMMDEFYLLGEMWTIIKSFIHEWWIKVNQISSFHNYNEKPYINFMSYVGVGNGMSYMTPSTYLFTSLSLWLKLCFAFTWLPSPFKLKKCLTSSKVCMPLLLSPIHDHLPKCTCLYLPPQVL